MCFICRVLRSAGVLSGEAAAGFRFERWLYRNDLFSTVLGCAAHRIRAAFDFNVLHVRCRTLPAVVGRGGKRQNFSIFTPCLVCSRYKQNALYPLYMSAERFWYANCGLFRKLFSDKLYRGCGLQGSETVFPMAGVFYCPPVWVSSMRLHPSNILRF